VRIRYRAAPRSLHIFATAAASCPETRRKQACALQRRPLECGSLLRSAMDHLTKWELCFETDSIARPAPGVGTTQQPVIAPPHMNREISKWPAALLPSALLIAVALVQIFLAYRTGLTPWKGGGFGMFSTTDGTGFRSVRLFVEAPDRSEELEIPPSLEDLADRAQAHPSTTQLDRLARATVAREQRKKRPVETVRVEVWRIDFAPETLLSTSRLLRQHQFHVPGQLDSTGR
jgi:hypothetical protein